MRPSKKRYGKRYEWSDLANLRVSDTALLKKLSRKVTLSTGCKVFETHLIHSTMVPLSRRIQSVASRGSEEEGFTYLQEFLPQLDHYLLLRLGFELFPPTLLERVAWR